MTVSLNTIPEKRVHTPNSKKKKSLLVEFLSLFREIYQDKKLRRIGYNLSFYEAVTSQSLKSEEKLFQSTVSGCPTIFTTSVTPFNGLKSHVSIKCTVTNKFMPFRPLTDFVDEFNPLYAEGAIKYLEDNRSKGIKINTMLIPFDVESIQLFATSFFPFQEDVLTFGDLGTLKVNIVDFHSKETLRIENLSEEFPKGNGILIGTLVRGYVVGLKDDWVYLDSMIPVKS